jgi:hypothetical protein
MENPLGYTVRIMPPRGLAANILTTENAPELLPPVLPEDVTEYKGFSQTWFDENKVQIAQVLAPLLPAGTGTGTGGGGSTPAQGVITFADAITKTVGDAPFTLLATSNNSVTPITFTSSNTSVITVSDSSGFWKATVVAAGNATITAFQAGSSSYTGATKAQVVTVQTAGTTTPPPATVTGISTNKILFTAYDGGVIENDNVAHFTNSQNNGVGGFLSNHAIPVGQIGAFQMSLAEVATGCMVVRPSKAAYLSTAGPDLMALWYNANGQQKIFARSDSTSYGATNEYRVSPMIQPGASRYGQIRFALDAIYAEYTLDNGSTWTELNKMPRVSNAIYWVSVVTNFGTDIRTIITHFNATIDGVAATT